MGGPARQEELLAFLNDVEVLPLTEETVEQVQSTVRLSFTQLAALGVGMEPLVAAVQQAVASGAGAGLFKAAVPLGSKLMKFRRSADFLGKSTGEPGSRVLSCDPTALFVAITLANLDRKLDAIREAQREMMDYIVQKDKSAIKGDLDFLSDVFDHYKLNWDDEKYKTANHIKALDIRQENSRRMDFYREQIKKHLGKKSFFYSDQEVKRQLAQVMDEFRDYRLSLYLFGFAYFLEVLLQENFDSAYLQSIAEKIDVLIGQYGELYAQACTQIEARTKTSLQSRVLSGLSIANRAAGEAVAKIPGMEKVQLDEKFARMGEKLDSFEEKRAKNALQQLAEQESRCVVAFVEQIRAVDRLYNTPMTLVFDSEAVYIPRNE